MLQYKYCSKLRYFWCNSHEHDWKNKGRASMNNNSLGDNKEIGRVKKAVCFQNSNFNSQLVVRNWDRKYFWGALMLIDHLQCLSASSRLVMLLISLCFLASHLHKFHYIHLVQNDEETSKFLHRFHWVGLAKLWQLHFVFIDPRPD